MTAIQMDESLSFQRQVDASIKMQDSRPSSHNSSSTTATMNNGKTKPSYKHVPHSQKPPHLVAKRNARERRRVQAVNQAFYKLRKSVPIENRNKRVSKVKTLQRAIDYIRKLERILAEDEQIVEPIVRVESMVGSKAQAELLSQQQTSATTTATSRARKSAPARKASTNCDQQQQQPPTTAMAQPQIIAGRPRRGRKPATSTTNPSAAASQMAAQILTATGERAGQQAPQVYQPQESTVLPAGDKFNGAIEPPMGYVTSTIYTQNDCQLNYNPQQQQHQPAAALQQQHCEILRESSIHNMNNTGYYGYQQSPQAIYTNGSYSPQTSVAMYGASIQQPAMQESYHQQPYGRFYGPQSHHHVGASLDADGCNGIYAPAADPYEASLTQTTLTPLRPAAEPVQFSPLESPPSLSSASSSSSSSSSSSASTSASSWCPSSSTLAAADSSTATGTRPANDSSVASSAPVVCRATGGQQAARQQVGSEAAYLATGGYLAASAGAGRAPPARLSLAAASGTDGNCADITTTTTATYHDNQQQQQQHHRLLAPKAGQESAGATLTRPPTLQTSGQLQPLVGGHSANNLAQQQQQQLGQYHRAPYPASNQLQAPHQNQQHHSANHLSASIASISIQPSNQRQQQEPKLVSSSMTSASILDSGGGHASLVAMRRPQTTIQEYTM